MSDLPVKHFKTAKLWRSWLAKNHKTSQGLWLKMAKKNSGIPSPTYTEALDEALCFGWIDSHKKSLDERFFLQKFSPRRPKSVWSKNNIAHVERLIREKRMTAAGLAQLKAAKTDGRLDRAYDPPSKATIPADFLKELKKDKKAYAFFQTLNRANQFAVSWRLQTAKKPETRAKRMAAILAMMADGKKFHG